MRPLVIGPEEKEKLQALKDNAEQNILSFDDLLDIKNKREPLVGDRPGFSCEIPVGFRVVFSLENHPMKDGSGFKTIRHMSMSVDAEGKLPNPIACKMIMEELGYKSELIDCIISIERNHAINILEEAN